MTLSSEIAIHTGLDPKGSGPVQVLPPVSYQRTQEPEGLHEEHHGRG
jgi:hypothetical protein